jgi:hypothetical protein
MAEDGGCRPRPYLSLQGSGKGNGLYLQGLIPCFSFVSQSEGLDLSLNFGGAQETGRIQGWKGGDEENSG